MDTTSNAELAIKDLNGLASMIHERMREKGLYDREILGIIPGKAYHVPSADPADGSNAIYNPSLASEKLLLIVSEITEAQDALRDGKEDEEALEVADIIIRALDYSAFRKIDIEVALAIKLAKNQKRPRLHGRREF